MPRNPAAFRSPLATNPNPSGCTTYLAGSRQWVDPWNMSMSQIELGDIALRLSNICRFGGDVVHHLSVAEHSVNVMLKLKSMCEKEVGYVPDSNAMLAALLHDASEAYIGDIHGPSKKLPMFAAYREAEDRLSETIYARFGVYLDDDLVERVHAADHAVFLDEWGTNGGQLSAKLARFQFTHWFDHFQRERIFKR